MADGFPIEQWYYEIPPVTRTYATLSVLTSLLCQVGVVTPLNLYFNYKLIVYQKQYWRLVTNFMFFGLFGLDLVFYLFFLTRYCRMLEENSFRGRTADFAWMLLFGAVVLTIIAPFINILFLGSALTFMMVYVWSKRNPDIRLNFLGFFNFNAPYLPWVLLAFSLFLNGSFPMSDALGIAIGHVYYFFDDVYPITSRTGKRYLRAPGFFKRLFENAPAGVEPVNAALIDQEGNDNPGFGPRPHQD